MYIHFMSRATPDDAMIKVVYTGGCRGYDRSWFPLRKKMYKIFITTIDFLQ